MNDKATKRLLLEEFCPQVGLGVSAASPVISGVKILGYQSRNAGGKRVYRRGAAAASLYEGMAVNIDHPDDPKRPGKTRPVSQRFGRLKNVSERADGFYGDLHYNPAHPLAEAVKWWAANDPAAIGLSHNAVGLVQEHADGGQEVSRVVKVKSVDLVTDPATTKSLYESAMDDLDLDTTAGGEGDSGSGWKEHLIDGIKKLLDADDIPDAAKKSLGKKLMDAAMADYSDDGDGDQEDDEKPDEKEEKVEESDSVDSLKAEVARLKSEKSARKLAGAKLKPELITEDLIESLIDLPEAKQVKLIESIRKSTSVQKPRSSPAGGKPGGAEMDDKQFKKQLLGR